MLTRLGLDPSLWLPQLSPSIIACQGVEGVPHPSWVYNLGHLAHTWAGHLLASPRPRGQSPIPSARARPGHATASPLSGDAHSPTTTSTPPPLHNHPGLMADTVHSGTEPGTSCPAGENTTAGGGDREVGGSNPGAPPATSSPGHHAYTSSRMWFGTEVGSVSARPCGTLVGPMCGPLASQGNKTQQDGDTGELLDICGGLRRALENGDGPHPMPSGELVDICGGIFPNPWATAQLAAGPAYAVSARPLGLAGGGEHTAAGDVGAAANGHVSEGVGTPHTAVAGNVECSAAAPSSEGSAGQATGKENEVDSRTACDGACQAGGQAAAKGCRLVDGSAACTPPPAPAGDAEGSPSADASPPHISRGSLDIRSAMADAQTDGEIPACGENHAGSKPPAAAHRKTLSLGGAGAGTPSDGYGASPRAHRKPLDLGGSACWSRRSDPAPCPRRMSFDAPILRKPVPLERRPSAPEPARTPSPAPAGGVHENSLCIFTPAAAYLNAGDAPTLLSPMAEGATSPAGDGPVPLSFTAEGGVSPAGDERMPPSPSAQVGPSPAGVEGRNAEGQASGAGPDGPSGVPPPAVGADAGCGVPPGLPAGEVHLDFAAFKRLMQREAGESVGAVRRRNEGNTRARGKQVSWVVPLRNPTESPTQGP